MGRKWLEIYHTFHRNWFEVGYNPKPKAEIMKRLKGKEIKDLHRLRKMKDFLERTKKHER